MREAEISWKKPRPEPSSGDEEDFEWHDEELKKVKRWDDDKLVVTIDQFRKSVGVDLTYAWFPIDEKPTVDGSASHEGLNFLGGLTENGETLFLECAGSFNKEATVQFLQALQAEFEEKPLVVLDKSSCFTAKKVKQFAEKSKLELLYLPTGMAKLNPTEECWRQLRSALDNKYFGEIDELRNGIRSVIEEINPPGVCQYLCR